MNGEDILDGAQVRAAHAAGAKFIVSPGLDRAVVEATLSLQLPVVPGAATASELMEARALALNVVKIFPAEQLGGAAGVRALTSPFGAMSFMPTGGVNDTNLASYLAVPGVIACGRTAGTIDGGRGTATVRDPASAGP